MRLWISALSFMGWIGGLATSASAIDLTDTRLMTLPAVSEDHVAFVYAEDLWVCRPDGSQVRRLTSHKGRETNPRFSPDGKTLAFSAQYDGNTDVYTVAVSGGEPRRLTFHPGLDLVQDFSVDGTKVLFISQREVYTRRFFQLFEASVLGGQPERLPIPNAFDATYSPDGKKIAYTPLPGAHLQWKNYRGGTASRIWLYDRGDHSVIQVPQPEGRCNDTNPMWEGDQVFFRSDRAGEFNLFRFDPSNNKVTQVTQHQDFPVLSASSNDKTIVYEQAGWLHEYDIASGDRRRMKIGVAADLTETRPRYASGNRYVRNGSISPSGARAAIEFRGEVVTLPREKGAPRYLTRTTGSHERNPVWSPDARWIAYFSDEAGEYELHVVHQGGKGGKRKFQLKGAGFYDSLAWSPDSKRVSFSDNSWSLYVLDLDTGDSTKISTEPIYGPVKTLSHSWSPDSRWIAYTRITRTYFQRVFLYNVEEKKSYPVTDGLSDVGEPVFDPGGKYLYCTASTDAGPVRQWFAMSNADMEMTNSVYLVVLDADESSPFLPESDEEEVDEPEEEATDSEAPSSDDAEGEGEEEEESLDPSAEASSDAASDEEENEGIKIDLAGIADRIIALPLSTALYSNLRAHGGMLYFLKVDRGAGLFGSSGSPTLHRFSLKSRKQETVASGVFSFSLSANGKKILAQGAGGTVSIVNASPGASLAKGKLRTEAIQVKVDPRKEWKQIYDEAWRINRDYFYAPNMHGADWDGLLSKYSVFLPHLAVRSDLNRVIQWLCSELAVGHHRVGGGDRPDQATSIPGGLLGADYEVHDGRYRFKKVYGGLNWNPTLRSPLTEPGVGVKEGEYLLSVDGDEVRAPNNLYRFFEQTSGRRVELEVGPNADGSDSRLVHVVPVNNEAALRNRDWVEGNLKRVNEATDGRVAYVYVPNTTSLGHTYFKRYFYPQAHKDAIIVDERHNGGGQVADYYIDALNRPVLCYWATRYGDDFKSPLSSIQGPKVMLIDETAGSGGDLLPWMFHKLGLGKLIGRRTWGGLVGTLGFPVLMDGGVVTAPNLGIWTEDGFVVESVGVPPDIEVEQLPVDVIAGRDPQLERAIKEILEELEKNPPQTPKRPPFPVRARR